MKLYIYYDHSKIKYKIDLVIEDETKERINHEFKSLSLIFLIKLTIKELTNGEKNTAIPFIMNF